MGEGFTLIGAVWETEIEYDTSGSYSGNIYTMELYLCWAHFVIQDNPCP